MSNITDKTDEPSGEFEVNPSSWLNTRYFVHEGYDPRVEAYRTDLPDILRIVPLPESSTLLERVEEDLDESDYQLIRKFGLEPANILITPDGQKILVSNILETPNDEDFGGKSFVGIYNLATDPVQFTLSYTSNSQATWRTLPYLYTLPIYTDHMDEAGVPANPANIDPGLDYWLFKPYDEEVMNLPIAFQRAFAEMQNDGLTTDFLSLSGVNFETDHPADDLAVHILNHSFTPVRAGKAAYRIATDEAFAEPDNLPDREELHLLYEFTSTEYGPVRALYTESVNGKFRYLIFEKSDGVRWVGVIEPNDAAMLEYFGMDKTIAGKSGIDRAKDIYAPPYEHDYDGTEADYYLDNTENLTGNIVLDAIS